STPRSTGCSRTAGNYGQRSRSDPDCAGLRVPYVPDLPENMITEVPASERSGARAERADRAKTTVVIADDHTVVRQGLRLLLDNEAGLQVVAEAGRVRDAERLARAHRPTVLVLDLNMPGGSSLDAIPRLRE